MLVLLQPSECEHNTSAFGIVLSTEAGQAACLKTEFNHGKLCHNWPEILLGHGHFFFSTGRGEGGDGSWCTPCPPM